MKRQLRILLAGTVVVVPFAVTVWLVIKVSAWLDNLAREPLEAWDVYDAIDLVSHEGGLTE